MSGSEQVNSEKPESLLRRGLQNPWACRILVVLCVTAAYARPLWRAELSDLDDRRFILENEAVQEFTPGQVVRYFTDPSTLDPQMWRGTYRPLRTLDFAIDWAIGGRDPRVFHLHSLLIHLLSSILAFEVFRTLARGRLLPALLGALLFALHPAHTECVAWVTSRGDLLVGMYILGALLAHLHRRYLLAGALFVLALFSKESAVVFPAAVVFADLFLRGRGTGAAVLRAGLGFLAAAPSADRRRVAAGKVREAWRKADLPWVPYLAYGALSALFYVLWLTLMGSVGHLPGWWGGTYLADLQAMVRGLAYYARILVLPVQIVFDYHVPATTTFDGGTLLGLLLLIAILFGCWKGGATFRFATAWFFFLILPTSNLLVTIGIPTAERFLYLPSVGFAFLAGTLAARVRPGWAAAAGAAVVVVCLGLLTCARAGVWKNMETLFRDTMAKADTPRTWTFRAAQALAAANAANDRLDPENPDPKTLEIVFREADRAIRLGDDLLQYFQETLGTGPGPFGGEVFRRRSNALLLMGRDEEAFQSAMIAIDFYAGADLKDAASFYNAALAADRMGRRALEGGGSETEKPDRNTYFRAAEDLSKSAALLIAAAEAGHPNPDLRVHAADAYVRAAEARIEGVSKDTPIPEQVRRIVFEYFTAAEIVAPFGGEWGPGPPSAEFSREAAARARPVYANAATTARYGSGLFEERDDAQAQLDLLLIAGEAFRRAGYLGEREGALPQARELFANGAACFADAARLGGKDPRAFRAAAYCLGDAGRVAEKLGDTAGALELYHDSLKLDPDPRVMDAIRRLEE